MLKRERLQAANTWLALFLDFTDNLKTHLLVGKLSKVSPAHECTPASEVYAGCLFVCLSVCLSGEALLHPTSPFVSIALTTILEGYSVIQ